jgi:hypothetical protein
MFRFAGQHGTLWTISPHPGNRNFLTRRFMIPNSYDSTADTLRHMAEVRSRLETAVVELLRRGRVHDASKFTPEEKPAFDEAIPAIRGLAYGSPAYNEVVARVRPALAVHYSRNSHHPEFYGERGIAGMDLFDLVEMLCDWMAAAQRNPSDGVRLDYNVTAFGIDGQLAAIIANTLARWPKEG